jgi:hypothetical protein
MVKARTPRLPAALTLSLVALVASFASCSDDAGSGGTATTADGGPVCDTCYNVYVNGGIVCAPGTSSDAWRSLSLCACGNGICADVCGDNFCSSMPANEACGACLIGQGEGLDAGEPDGGFPSCAAEEANCAAN